jgi:hypothetical protein
MVTGAPPLLPVLCRITIVSCAPVTGHLTTSPIQKSLKFDVRRHAIAHHQDLVLGEWMSHRQINFSLKKLCDVANPLDPSPLIAGDRCHKLKRVLKKLIGHTDEHPAASTLFPIVGRCPSQTLRRPIVAPPPK